MHVHVYYLDMDTKQRYRRTKYTCKIMNLIIFIYVELFFFIWFFFPPYTKISFSGINDFPKEIKVLGLMINNAHYQY